MSTVKRIVKSTLFGLSMFVLVFGPVAAASATVLYRTAPASLSLKNPVSREPFNTSQNAKYDLGKKAPTFNKAAKELFDPNSKTPKYSTGHIIVKFKTSGMTKRSAIAGKYDSSLINRIDGTRSFTAKVPAGNSVAKLVKEMAKDPAVEYAEPDYKRVALGQKTSWGYDSINAEAAHTDNAVTGSGVTIAIVDTGVDWGHADLNDNIWSNPGEVADNDTDDDANGFVDDIRGWDFGGTSITNVTGDNNPNDTIEHGTHVSGIAAAEDNSIGTVGVAPEATIMPVKVFDDLFWFALDSTIADGIHYAVDNGADIINMSLGGPVPSRLMSEAMTYAANNDVAVAVAAGNSFGFNAFTSYPAAYPSAISVGALEEAGTKTWWSNWGKVDVMAPGDEILSTIPDDRYAEYSGTSMASPFVAGELALIKEAHPGFDANQLRQVLQTTATDSYRPSQDHLNGSGTVDADAATEALAASLNLTATAFRIIADDNDFTDGISTITARVMDSDGDPVVGETVDFTTDRGDLSAASDVTDGDGLATTNLTADDVSGLANITATTAGYGSATIQVVLFNDKVNIFELRVMNAGCSSDCPEVEPEATVPDPATFSAGQDVSFDVTLRDLGLIYLDAYSGRTADFSWEVLDSDSDPVAGLSGTRTDQDISVFNPYSLTETLPDDMADGRYTLEVTVTDDDSGKTDEAATPFTVGDSDNNILVVAPTNYFFSDPYLLDTVIWESGMPIAPITTALDELDETYDVWPNSGTPDIAILEQYPIVIFAASAQDDISIITDYLNSGGNAFVSGNTDWLSFVFEDNTGGTGWCAGTPVGYSVEELFFSCPDEGTEYQPTDNGDVAGTADSIFDGMSFNVDPYNLNGDGAKNQFYTDRFTVEAGGDPILDYSGGQKGGLSADNDVYRLVLTGIGIEGVHSNVGTDTRADLLGAALGFLKPASLTVDSVSPTRADRGTAKTITVTGTGFETTGNTIVTLGGIGLGRVNVIDRTTLTARIPASYPTLGLKDLTVTNPFGQSDTLSDAVRIRHPAPHISSVSPEKASNNKARTITIKGSHFRSGATVKLDSKTLSGVNFVSNTKITATVPKGKAVGTYDVTVTNTDGRHDSLNNAYKVRFGFTYELHFGMLDPAVKVLEKRLDAGGYFPSGGTIDNFYGSATVAAVQDYQSAHGLAATGIVDLATRNYLNNH